MARKFSIIPTSLWNDELFLAHNWEQKYLYVFLRGQPRLDAAAMMTIHEKYWALKLGISTEAVLDSLDALAASHFVEIDLDMQELFVSGVFASEKLGAQPRRAKAAYTAIRQAESDRLRAIALAELANELMKGSEKVPTGLRAAVLERDGYRCQKCGWAPSHMVYTGAAALADIRGLEVDHVYPKALGGSNDLSNLQALCSDCNSAKGARV